MYLRGSRTQSTGRFSPLASLDRTGRSSPTKPFYFLFSFLVPPFSPCLSHQRNAARIARAPITVSPLPFTTTNRPLSFLHLEMRDDRWFTAVEDMLGNYSETGGKVDNILFTAIYCLNPPDNDGCPVGICPNPDVAGTLLRIARKFPLSFLPGMII